VCRCSQTEVGTFFPHKQFPQPKPSTCLIFKLKKNHQEAQNETNLIWITIIKQIKKIIFQFSLTQKKPKSAKIHIYISAMHKFWTIFLINVFCSWAKAEKRNDTERQKTKKKIDFYFCVIWESILTSLKAADVLAIWNLFINYFISYLLLLIYQYMWPIMKLECSLCTFL
jgi:hypothetical protein